MTLYNWLKLVESETDKTIQYSACMQLFEDQAGFKNLLAKPEDNPKTRKPAITTKALANPKLAKGSKVGVLTVPLHLSPADTSGFNVCSCSTPGCRASCLNTAGNPAHLPGKERARKSRTIKYMTDRKAFVDQLVKEVAAHQRSADRKNMLAAVRLNATSDIPWERVPVTYKDEKYPNIMEAFQDVVFYDYTKIFKRMMASLKDSGWPRNYYMTFSLSENNDHEAAEVLRAGGNVAVVFHLAPSQPLPKTYSIDGETWPVGDGEQHDFRPYDEQNIIVGLRAKGKAKKDTTGFVRDV